jgi:hypothetical protein
MHMPMHSMFLIVFEHHIVQHFDIQCNNPIDFFLSIIVRVTHTTLTVNNVVDSLYNFNCCNSIAKLYNIIQNSC